KATPRTRPRMICQWSFLYQGRRGVSIGVCRKEAGSEATMGGRQRSEEEGQQRDGRAGGGAGQVDAVVRHPWDARREREWEAVVLAPLGERALGEAVPRLHGRAEEGVEEGARQRAPGDEQPHRRLGGAPGERRREWERATEDDGGAEERRGGTGHGNAAGGPRRDPSPGQHRARRPAVVGAHLGPPRVGRGGGEGADEAPVERRVRPQRVRGEE